MNLTKYEIFELGKLVAWELSGAILKPTQDEIRAAASTLNLTQRDAKVALEYYNFGHTYPKPPIILRT